MANKAIVTLLGFEDEPITEKNSTLVNFSTNKIGGQANSPGNLNVSCPNCPLCQLPRLLVVQIYAPNENSSYHRTLYVFACINPNCWNLSESWICLRGQHFDGSFEERQSSTGSGIKWCQEADEWDDDNSNSEENGNVVTKSDEEDGSASMDESYAMQHLSLDDNDKNANARFAEAQGGAVGTIQSPTASAEIEGAESEVVSIDTPTFPQRDITSIMNQVGQVPLELFRKKTTIQFTPYFMSVFEEEGNKHVVDGHVRELLQEYQKQHEDFNVSAESCAKSDATLEKYEKSVPAHGDKMFHWFVSKIRQHPGQVLRYGRGSNALLLYPATGVPKECIYCKSSMEFEFQILPTIIPLLQLEGVDSQDTRLEFGNVLIYTCSKSCWSSDTAVVRKEEVVVQAE